MQTGARRRHLDLFRVSGIVPTPMAAAYRLYPTISVISQSPVDGTPDKRLHFPAKLRVGFQPRPGLEMGQP